MEIEDTSSGASIAFPLGLALLVALLLFFCCFFCCCLHWEKLRPFFPFSSGIISNHPHHTPPYTDTTPPPHKPGFPVLMVKQNRGESFPVLMPGDEVPKFIALACPCQPATNESITIHVVKAAPNDLC
ncbi:hypothetical protein PHAVU_009G145900 [Phaseolus vulgaris]|uniref:Hydroxyproline-rich glycoprotein family protein n=1 Tax=Phaseolus vulgaris TaxID=3885 RepID=V7AVS6_PHAVU|nr:hypothetical protein PHAVU_009G145900g [Phaseolus vulgaris]ESW09664.1 hypothetical protein PHAVU_009G145900g [Phaseolus vulgaris]